MASIPTLLSHFFANKVPGPNQILKEKYNQNEASHKLSSSRDIYNKDGAYLRVKKIKNDFLIKNKNTKCNLNQEILRNPLISPRFKDKLNELILVTPNSSNKIKLEKAYDINSKENTYFKNRQKELLSLINVDYQKFCDSKMRKDQQMKETVSLSTKKVSQLEKLLNKKNTVNTNKKINNVYYETKNKQLMNLSQKNSDINDIQNFEKDFQTEPFSVKSFKANPKHHKTKSQIITCNISNFKSLV